MQISLMWCKANQCLPGETGVRNGGGITAEYEDTWRGEAYFHYLGYSDSCMDI